MLHRHEMPDMSHLLGGLPIRMDHASAHVVQSHLAAAEGSQDQGIDKGIVPAVTQGIRRADQHTDIPVAKQRRNPLN